jgi:hypothetical protein
MRRRNVLAAVLLLGGCSVTARLAVLGPNGEVLTGTATATLAGGTFSASDPRLSCTGQYDSLSMEKAVMVSAQCSDGRSGVGTAIRTSSRSGHGAIRLNDGAEAKFIFGEEALAFAPTLPHAAEPAVAPIPLVAPATATSNRLGTIWATCLSVGAKTIALETNEPADTAVEAVFGVCAAEQRAVVDDAFARGDDGFDLARAIKSDVKPRLIAIVIETRIAARAAPPSSAVPAAPADHHL